ncbi:MAG TPA: tetratricopeptide repeat protein [Candidatus Eisenbergiella merdipullorum]|uniref:Tetratricopeptide repeat protein n=1 Tax=Candidatus Eisenbergiella merdipullorum TaxID=2838553 RepID=A0A9D2I7D4_9FIRM|nr:tetratricopeptide repeat protein [Candidatus Eisenbergiella merdipullorum]
MNCYNCGALLTENDFCTNCGADVKHYKKIIGLSNVYYNDGLEKANVRDLSGAIRSLTECLKLNKFNIDARNLLGLIYFEMGETVNALSEWVLSKNLKPEKNIADDYIKAVQDNPSQLENLNQAIKKYNQALVYCQQGSLDLAVIQLKKVLSINPRFLRAHQLLALLYIQAEDWEKAKRELNKCSRIDVRNTTTLRYMKEVSAAAVEDDTKGGHRNRKTEDVIKYQSGNETIIQPVNVQEPKKSFAFLIYLLVGAAVGLAVALTLIMPARIQSLRTQLNEESRAVGEQLDKRNAEVSDLQAQLADLEERNTALTDELDAYAGTDGTLQTVEDLLNAAYIYLDTPEDIEGLTEALDAVDAESMDSESMSEAYRNLYDKLLELTGPEISQNCLQNGNTAYRDGDYDTAIEELQKAFTYDETNSDALLLLGDAYRRKGDSRNAIQVYDQVVDLFPNTENARRAENALNELEG